MPITNTPIKQLQDYTFDEIGTFSPAQLAGVAMNQQFTPVTNISRVKSYETWETVDTTWATETRTWLDMGSLMDNTSFKNLGSYTVDELASFSADQIGGVEFSRQFSPIINTNKPS